MPTYDYRCKKCAHEFAVVQGITEKPRCTCPKCHGRVERLVTGGGFILKGKGFYTTDYRSSDYKQAAEREKKSGQAKQEKKAEKKDKPAAKKAKEAAG